MCAKFYQNRRNFVTDMTKTFWCVFFGSQCSSISCGGYVHGKFEYELSWLDIMPSRGLYNIHQQTDRLINCDKAYHYDHPIIWWILSIFVKDTLQRSNGCSIWPTVAENKDCVPSGMQGQSGSSAEKADSEAPRSRNFIIIHHYQRVIIHKTDDVVP